MNLTIDCKVSLSKKLREVLGKSGGTIVLTTSDLQDGKGFGRLSLSSELRKQYEGIPEELGGETSIQITAIGVTSETPSGDTVPQAAIFSTIPSKGESSPVINRMAAVHAPDKGEESHAVVAKKDIKTPEAFSTLEEKGCREWIGNMEELVEAIMAARGKKSDIDPDMAQNDRERALLIELKEKDEAIDRPAWVVNTGGGTLMINDLDIVLPMNSPYDLSNISARRIIMSRDLKELIKGNYVKFISPAERGKYILGQSEGDMSMGLPVFDSPEEAEEHMVRSVSANPVIDEDSAMDITENDIEGLTDEESMVVNLTQGMPSVRSASTASTSSTAVAGGAQRHTVHGGSKSSDIAKSSGISPIRKLT